MFIELHMLQNFAPSNLNRDDTNNPKDCEFGGVRRARISSQCIKRAIRKESIFAETTQVELGMRTRWLARRIAESLTASGKPQEEADDVAIAFVNQYLGSMDKKAKQRSSVLMYLSAEEIRSITEMLARDWDTSLAEVENSTPFNQMVKDLVKATRDHTSAPDIAMFGRMLANEPKLNLDAACQVAHAISTHRVSMEMDFFTAVDDLQQEEETGAGMMGIMSFSSACFYRYSRIDWGQLLKNLDGDTGLARKTVEGFLRAAVQAVPTGKQNSFAAQNPPSFLLVVVRQDGKSWSLANAFERPVHPDRSGGVVKPSIEALDAYWGQLNRVYGDAAVPVHAAALAVDGAAEFPNLQDAQLENVTAWVDAVLNNLPQE